MIRIIEVGPRDGLQNESNPVPTDLKLRFIERLSRAGVREIEATSFVSPKWVPQLADAVEIWPSLPAGPAYSALVPNVKGLERALSVGVDRIALFTAASEAFTLKNVNMTIDQTIEVFGDVVTRFRGAKPNGFVRGYVSTIFDCPYAGAISEAAVADVTRRLFELGVDEVSLGDTIGVGVPADVRRVASAVSEFGKARLVWHFHDTYGTAISNVAAALELGYGAFDAAAAGLGGCPYAPGAAGNVATEDLVYFLERSGVTTGIDLTALSQASAALFDSLGRPSTSKARSAVLARSGV